MNNFFEIGFYIILFAFVFYAIRKSKKFSDLNSECGDLKKSIEVLNSEKFLTLEELKKLKMCITEKSEALELSDKKIVTLENEVDFVNKNLKEKDHRLNDCQNQLNLLLIELNKERDLLRSKSESFDLMKDKLYDVEVRFDGVSGDLINVKKELFDCQGALNNSLLSLEKEKCLFDNLNDSYQLLICDLNDIKSKYLPLADKFEDAVNLVSSLKTIKEDVKKIEEERGNLSLNYANARQKYDELLLELGILEERLDLYSFGVYEPHFEFNSSEEYKAAMNEFYEERKNLTKNNLAATCTTTWTINGSKVEGKKQTRHFMKIMLRAFNGECDAALAKVRWNNVKSMEERIKKSFDAINNLGETHCIYLNKSYLDVRLKELWLAHECQEKIYEEKEEQKRIREQIREEERSLREMEAARIEAEKEEERYLKALKKAQAELLEKHGEEKEILARKIQELEINLQNAIDLKNRAISMAQITKAGYVYIISNIGSFGEDIYKIGMTRRLDPLDRVRELSGASVPFSFDVHGLIYSENAPDLESKLHKNFKDKRVNLINGRKEFFKINLNEIANFLSTINCNVQFTKLAEARDFRETLALREKMSFDRNSSFSEKFPIDIFDDLERQNACEDDELKEFV
jgi:predicted  nucleic acid-binding Zn-ribbon protein